jgi:apolipoprotein N-acyltransferase
VGRCSDLLPVRVTGTSVRQIMIDPRLSFYTRFGDIFAYGCDALAVGIAVRAWWEKRIVNPRKEES